jgi:hypothetical protein
MGSFPFHEANPSAARSPGVRASPRRALPGPGPARTTRTPALRAPGLRRSPKPQQCCHVCTAAAPVANQAARGGRGPLRTYEARRGGLPSLPLTGG